MNIQTSLLKVQSVVCRELNLNETVIWRNCRIRELADARKIIWYILFRDFGYKQREIASISHSCQSTIAGALKRVSELLQVDKQFKEQYEKIRHAIFAI